MADQDQIGAQAQQPSNFKRWAIIVLLVILAIFVLENSQKVTIDFLFFTSVEAPLIIALLVSALLGALIGWLAPRARRRD